MKKFLQKASKIRYKGGRRKLLLAVFLTAASAALIAGPAFTESWNTPFSWFLKQYVSYSGVGSPYDSDNYVIIGWNDLGMHCIDPTYSDIAVLPPFNNLWVQVIRKGDPPTVVTSGVTVEYSIINNTTVTGKNDFWQTAASLYAGLMGVSTPLPGTGLTGSKLSGKLVQVDNHFEVKGIPILPYDDQMNWNPYQTALVKLKDSKGKMLARTQVVIPVSDELNCAKCHMQGMDGTVNLDGGGSESIFQNILAVHDYYHGSSGVTTQGINLMENRPAVCASCHADNALGAPGKAPSQKSLSLAMHGWHAQSPDAQCYDCHPGAATQCMRTGIAGMGYLGDEPNCKDCHGDKQQVADSILAGRQPWLNEPTCEQCHGVNYSTGGTLYRNAKGHGGLSCPACHNSPHAWWPSKNWADNLQPMKLQKQPYSVAKCSTCHTKKKAGDNPHVSYYLQP